MPSSIEEAKRLEIQFQVLSESRHRADTRKHGLFKEWLTLENIRDEELRDSLNEWIEGLITQLFESRIQAKGKMREVLNQALIVNHLRFGE